MTPLGMVWSLGFTPICQRAQGDRGEVCAFPPAIFGVGTEIGGVLCFVTLDRASVEGWGAVAGEERQPLGREPVPLLDQWECHVPHRRAMSGYRRIGGGCRCIVSCGDHEDVNAAGAPARTARSARRAGSLASNARSKRRTCSTVFHGTDQGCQGFSSMLEAQWEAHGLL
jgi:hypothetical protein